jgi:hypothetical protein
MSQYGPPGGLAIVHPGDDATLASRSSPSAERRCSCSPSSRLADGTAPSQRTTGPIGLVTKNGTETGQPVVQGRSFSGFRTAQMCLIRSPATSNATTVTVTPAC